MIKAYKYHLDNGHKKIIDLVKEAQKIGRKAAKDRLKKLEEVDPQWALRGAFTRKPEGTMLDVRGSACLIIPGNGKTVRTFKKFGRKEGEHFNVSYNIDDMYIVKAYKRGYHLNLRLTESKYLSVNEEAVWRASEFLNLMGLECQYSSRID